MLLAFGNSQVLLAHAPSQCPQRCWAMCHRSLSTISPDPHPRNLLAPHCCPQIWLGCIPCSSASWLRNTETSFFQLQVSCRSGRMGRHSEQQTLQRRLRAGVQGRCQGCEAGAAQPQLPWGTEHPPHPGRCTAQPSTPSTKKGGSLSAQNQKVVNDIHIRHRKLD